MRAGNRLVPIEIKSTATPTARHLQPRHELIAAEHGDIAETPLLPDLRLDLASLFA